MTIQLEHTSDNAHQYNALVEQVYHELRHFARYQRRAFNSGLTLQTTALVHEAYLKLADGNISSAPSSEAHMKALCSRVIRQVLVDYARRSQALKRQIPAQDFPDLHSLLEETSAQLSILDLDAALEQLGEISPRLVQVVEQRFFGGMSSEETAQQLDISRRTVERDWLRAKAWLAKFMKKS